MRELFDLPHKGDEPVFDFLFVGSVAAQLLFEERFLILDSFNDERGIA